MLCFCCKDKKNGVLEKLFFPCNTGWCIPSGTRRVWHWCFVWMPSRPFSTLPMPSWITMPLIHCKSKTAINRKIGDTPNYCRPPIGVSIGGFCPRCFSCGSIIIPFIIVRINIMLYYYARARAKQSVYCLFRFPVPDLSFCLRSIPTVFPKIDYSHHPAIQKILIQTCHEFGVPYTVGHPVTIWKEMVQSFATPRSLMQEIVVYAGGLWSKKKAWQDGVWWCIGSSLLAWRATVTATAYLRKSRSEWCLFGCLFVKSEFAYLSPNPCRVTLIDFYSDFEKDQRMIIFICLCVKMRGSCNKCEKTGEREK